MVCTPTNPVPRSEIDFLFCFVFSWGRRGRERLHTYFSFVGNSIPPSLLLTPPLFFLWVFSWLLFVFLNEKAFKEGFYLPV